MSLNQAQERLADLIMRTGTTGHMICCEFCGETPLIFVSA